jgi:hypothetical protein
MRLEIADMMYDGVLEYSALHWFALIRSNWAEELTIYD